MPRKRPATPKLTGTAREDRVLELRDAGADFAVISKQLGFASAGSAKAAYTRAAKRAAVPAGPTVDELKVDADALELRRAGLTFLAIADRLGLVDAAAGRAAYERGLERTATVSTPEQVRELEVDRLDRLQVALWPKALKGDLAAVDRLLKITEQRTKLRAQAASSGNEIRLAFDASVAGNKAVNQVLDGALIEAGRRMADRIDAATANGEGQEVTKALYLVPHLNNILRELLATPAARLEDAKGDGGAGGNAKGGSKLVSLRSQYAQDA